MMFTTGQKVAFATKSNSFLATVIDGGEHFTEVVITSQERGANHIGTRQLVPTCKLADISSGRCEVESM